MTDVLRAPAAATAQGPRSSDQHARSIGSEHIPADRLRQLVRECIERHVDQEQLKVLRVFEDNERNLLRSIAAIHAGGASS